MQKMFDFSAERTLQSVEESLKRLGLDYIDVIQVLLCRIENCQDVIEVFQTGNEDFQRCIIGIPISLTCKSSHFRERIIFVFSCQFSITDHFNSLGNDISLHLAQGCM